MDIACKYSNKILLDAIGMLTLNYHPDLFGVADNNPYRQKVYALRLARRVQLCECCLQRSTAAVFVREGESLEDLASVPDRGCRGRGAARTNFSNATRLKLA
jgi:hypothetical protein